MSFRVLKFGGSNLREPQDLSKCAEITAGYEAPCVIVVSAFYGITDKLQDAAVNASDKGIPAAKFIEGFSSLCYRWLDAAYFTDKSSQSANPHEQERSNNGRELQDSLHNCDEPEQNSRNIEMAALKGLRDMLDTLSRLLNGVHAIGELPPAIRDNILSYGERISAYVFNEALKARNIAATLALPEDIGLRTGSDFGNAGVNLNDSLAGTEKYFCESKYYVVPGFYGISPEGKTTLLGRGGTDYSAASLANLLNAGSLDIWKDVDGFQTADPGLVDKSQTIEKLSYSEAAELSYFGAKILHPRTVEPLQKKNIPVRIFNARSHEKEPKSLIGPFNGEKYSGPKSITFSRDFSVIKFKGAGVGSKPGVLAHIAGMMDLAGVNISSVFTSQTAICFLLRNPEMEKAEKAVKQGYPDLISEVETVTGIALVALVGEGITRERGVAAKIFNAVAEENINVEIIAAGASTSAVYFIVKESDCENAVKAVHRFFFTGYHSCAGWHLINTL